MKIKKSILLVSLMSLSLLLFCSSSFASSPVAGTSGSVLNLPIASSSVASGNYVVVTPDTSGSYTTGSSSPTSILTTYPNEWSGTATWDLSNVSALAGHTITGVAVTWKTSPASGYSGMHFALFDGSGTNGYYLPFSGVQYNDFVGESPEQKWTCQFWVSSWNNPGYELIAYPEQLTIWYN